MTTMTDLKSTDSIIGMWILGQYRVVRVLAEGGMGRLYLAEQASMDRYAAIKVLFTEGSKDDQWQTRFRQEARAASRLAHPNIVTVYNFGELADGSLFLAMEYIEGISLAEVTREGQLSLPQALDIGIQCASALQHAHEKQVVHRDFKPENVMVVRQQGNRYLAKVVDFGIALLLESDRQSDITRPGELVGTPRYLSPEQCRGEPATELSDQYALGLALYELVAGVPPFEANSTLAYLRLHEHVTPPAPSANSGRPELEPLDPIVLRMLSKEPEGRYPQMGEVCVALGQVLGAIGGLNGGEAESWPTHDGGPGAVRETKALRRGSGSGAADTHRDLHTISFDGEISPLSEKDCAAFSSAARSNLSEHSEHTRFRIVGGATGQAAGEPSPNATARLFGMTADGWQPSARSADDPLPRPEDTLYYIDARLQDKRLDDADRFKHLLIGPRPLDPLVISIALDYMIRNERGGIEQLFVKTPVQLLQASKLSQKSHCVDALLEDARINGVRRHSLHPLAEVAEELLTNAIIHAWDRDGQASSTEFQLPAGMEATLRWAIGDRFVAVSIQDTFGGLTARQVLERVTGPVAPLDLTRQGETGVGMGLRILSQAARHVFFILSPGTWCEILALIEREPSGDDRTLCILQGMGAPVQQLGNRLRGAVRRDVGRTYVKLEGEVNETSNLTPVFAQEGTLYLDLEGIDRINSLGLRNLLDGARAAPAERVVYQERCSEAWVRQLNLIPALCEIGEVVSIMAPYCCDGCGHEALELLLVEQLGEEIPPRQICPHCNTVMQFDAPPAEYFAFLPDARGQGPEDEAAGRRRNAQRASKS